MFHWGLTLTNSRNNKSQHDWRRSRYGNIFTIHAHIEYTFWGLEFLYYRIACLHLLNTFHLIHMSLLLQLDGMEEHGEQMVIYDW